MPAPLASRSVILFDLDGTLVDSRLDITDAFVGAVGAVLPGSVLAPEAVAALIGWPLAEMAARLGLALGRADAAAFEDAYRVRFDALRAARTSVHAGVPELLAVLAASRRLAVVTAKLERQAEMVLDVVGLRPRFAHVQGWAPGVRQKPDPHLVSLALERLGAFADDAVLIGDTAADMRAGSAAGVATVAATWGFGTRSELEAARPTHLADSTAELARLLG